MMTSARCVIAVCILAGLLLCALGSGHAGVIEEGTWMRYYTPPPIHEISFSEGRIVFATSQGPLLIDRRTSIQSRLPWSDNTERMELMPGGDFWSLLPELKTPVGVGRGAIRHYDGLEWRDFDESCGLPQLFGMWRYLNPMFAKDASGDVWAAYPPVIWRFDGERYESYQVHDFLPGNWVRCLAVDASDAKWFGVDEGGAVSFDGSGWQFHDWSDSLGTGGVVKLAADPEEGIWALWGYGWGSCTITSLSRFVAGAREDCRFEPPMVTRRVSMAVDPAGRVWIGTYGEGAYCLDSGEWRHYRTADGLASDYIVDIDADEDGAVGFLCYSETSSERPTSEYAVSVLSEGAWLTYHAEADLPWEETDILKIDDEGSIWLGGGEAYSSQTDFLWRIGRGGRCDSFPPPAASLLRLGPARLGESFVFAWAGSDEYGLAVLDGDTWQTRTDWDGISLDNIKQIEADAFGRVWLRRDLGAYQPTALVCIWPEANWAGEYRPSGNPFDISTIAIDREDDCIWLSFEGREQCYGYGQYGGFQKLSARGIERILENAPRSYVGVDARNMKWLREWTGTSTRFELFDGQNWHDMPALPWANLRMVDGRGGRVVEHTGDFVALLYDHEKWAALDDPSAATTCSTIAVYSGEEWRGLTCPESLNPENPPRYTWCSIPITGVDWLGNYWLGLGVLVPPENFVLAPKALIGAPENDEALQLRMSIGYQAHPHKADLYAALQAPSGQVFYVAGHGAEPPFPIFYAAFDGSTEFLQPGPDYDGPGSIPNTPDMKDLAPPPLPLPDPPDGNGPTGLALFAYPVPYFANVPLPAYGSIENLVLLNTELPEEAPTGTYTFHVGMTAPSSISNLYRTAQTTFEVTEQ